MAQHFSSCANDLNFGISLSFFKIHLPFILVHVTSRDDADLCLAACEDDEKQT